jgi:hypothetical protein
MSKYIPFSNKDTVLPAEDKLLTVPAEKRTTELAISADENPRHAEKMLCVLADKEGDGAVVALLENTAPIVLAGIMREHDASSPTILYHLLDSSQVVKVLEVEAAYWPLNDVESRDIGKVRNLQKNAFDLILTILTHADPSKRAEIIEAIRESEKATIYLRFVFAGWKPELENWGAASVEEVDETEVASDGNEAFEENFLSAIDNIGQCELIFSEGTMAHLFNVIRLVNGDFAQNILFWVLERRDEESNILLRNLARDLIDASVKPLKTHYLMFKPL